LKEIRIAGASCKRAKDGKKVRVEDNNEYSGGGIVIAKQHIKKRRRKWVKQATWTIAMDRLLSHNML
jgi:hypothetical protein